MRDEDMIDDEAPSTYPLRNVEPESYKYMRMAEYVCANIDGDPHRRHEYEVLIYRWMLDNNMKIVPS